MIPSPPMSQRIILEPLQASHAAQMFDGLQDIRAYTFIPSDPPASLAALTSRYEKLESRISPDGAESWLNWMVRLQAEQTYIGFVQATIDIAHNTALIAYHIFPAHWGHGFGREAVAAMLSEIHQHHNVREASALIDTRNAASIKLVKALGFSLRKTIIAADFFRGESSDEYDYVLALGK